MEKATLRQLLHEQVLPRVTKPARYLGNEWNSVHKPWSAAKVRMAFAFPDIYEVGMSHLGLQILYGLVNDQEDYLLERVFAPWVDMENLMREKGIPLFSLESGTPVSHFDLLGFTLQYEMSYSNILNMLDLGGIPLLAAERGNKDPLVVGGGPCSFNPEPLADFFDLFVIGEGEEVVLELLAAVNEAKTGGVTDRKEMLRHLARIPGVYVPSFYSVRYLSDGSVAGIDKTEALAPDRVKRRVLGNLDAGYFPTRPIVPFLEVVHDRIMLEVARGCTRGCRFCQAGVIYRPVRERSPALLQSQAENLVRSTGHSEISLTSLSTADYSRIEDLTRSLLDRFGPELVNISLPSLRIDAFSVELARELQRVRKGGLTFAPEAGTQRLRDVINKGVTEADLLSAAAAGFTAGWSKLKLYFMIGLPTETQEDIEGIAELAHKVADLGTRTRGRSGRIQITVSTSSFVPKPWTPFQWEGLDPIPVLREKQRWLQQRLRDRRITYSWHDAELSFLEAVFARGDRRLGQVLLAAWDRGCKFDSWGDQFQFARWLAAFSDAGLDPGEYAHWRPGLDTVLPWDHLDAGVSKVFLKQERQRALQGIRTGDCRVEQCPGCGVCGNLAVEPILAGGDKDGPNQS